jgi:hypothetical protein
MDNTFKSYNVNAKLWLDRIRPNSSNRLNLFGIKTPKCKLIAHSYIKRYSGSNQRTSISEKILVSRGLIPGCSVLRNDSEQVLDKIKYDMEPGNYFSLDESPDGISIETDYTQSFSNLKGNYYIAHFIEDILLKNMNKLPKFINNYFDAIDIISEEITDIHLFIGTQRLRNGEEHKFVIINIFINNKYNMLFTNAANVRGTTTDHDKAKFVSYTTISYANALKNNLIISKKIQLSSIKNLGQYELEKTLNIHKFLVKKQLNFVRNNIYDTSIIASSLRQLEEIV